MSFILQANVSTRHDISIYLLEANVARECRDIYAQGNPYIHYLVVNVVQGSDFGRKGRESCESTPPSYPSPPRKGGEGTVTTYWTVFVWPRVSV